MIGRERSEEQDGEDISVYEYWQNTTVICDDLVDELSKLKEADSNTIVLGSNNLCKTLILEGLLDDIQIVVNPVLLGKGTPLFMDLSKTTELILKETTVFESGKALSCMNSLANKPFCA